MDKEKFINKNNVILLWIFAIITVIHVLYATFSIRVAYMDGAPEILHILNSISDGTLRIFMDSGHTRYLSNAIMQLPVYAVYSLYIFKTKYSLAAFYSFCWFAIVPILIYFNYKLAKRTKKYDTFVLSVSLYSMLFLLHKIFAVVESPMTILFVLILYNYISAKIDYTKTDKIILAFLVIMLFSSQELVLFCGPILFIASIFYSRNEKSINNQMTRLLTGAGALFASMYVLLYVFSVKNNDSEALRYINEICQTMPLSLTTNFLITAIGLVILIATILIYRAKKEIPSKTLIIYSFIIFYGLLYMMNRLDIYVNPVREGHFRVLDTFLFPLILAISAIKDLIWKETPKILQNNILSVSILVGIALSIWQINDTYWWNKNIEYMQNELNNCTTALYIPDEHEPPISKFFENDKRNYIWHADYTAISILFAKDYKVKTLLSVYNNLYEDSNANEREALFTRNNVLSLPFVSIKIKNIFWDLREPAKELDKYTKIHNIKTHKYDD